MGYSSAFLFLLSASVFLQGDATPVQPYDRSLRFHPRASIEGGNNTITLATGTGIIISTKASTSSSISLTSSLESTSVGTPFPSTLSKNATISPSATKSIPSSSSTPLTTRSLSSNSTSSAISITSGNPSSTSSDTQTRKPSSSSSEANSSETGKSSSSSQTQTSKSSSSGSETNTSKTGTPSSSSPSQSDSSKSPTSTKASATSKSSSGTPGSGVLPFSTTSKSQNSETPASITWSGSWSASTSGPTTANWPFFLVPTTTIAPAEATHEAFLLADLFFALKANRQWITDAKLKSQYIDNLEKSRDEVVALFNALDVKPEPKSDCSNLKRRNVVSEKKIRAIIADRSLLSAVADLAKDVAGLITCAEKVVSNLIDNVKLPEPPIPVIESLTDVLGTIGEDLKEDDPEDEDKTSTESQSQSSTTSSSSSSLSSSCTGVTQFPVCTQTISLSTSFYSGATSFTVATITSTACKTSTITGCASGTTATTTASTTSSGVALCSPGCAECAWDGPTPAPSQTGIDIEARAMPTAGASVDAFYEEILEDKDYTRLELAHRSTGTKSSAKFDDFESTPNYMMVAGLFGCTAVTVVSEKGAWMSHHWEAPGFGPGTIDSEFQKNILDVIKTQEQVPLARKPGTPRDAPREYIPAQLMPALWPLLATGQKLGPETHREIFISTPHADDNPNEYLYKDRVNLLIDLLTGTGAPLAGVTLTVRKYEKFKAKTPAELSALDLTARGKMMVQYDNNQVAASGTTKQQAMWKVWMETDSYSHSWDATDIQTGSCTINQKRDGSCSRPSSSAYEGGDIPITNTGGSSSPTSTGKGPDSASITGPSKTSSASDTSATKTPATSGTSNSTSTTLDTSKSSSSKASIISTSTADTSAPSRPVISTSTTPTLKPSSSTPKQTSTTTTSAAPEPTFSQTCNDIGNIKWVARDAAINNAKTFCADAAKQGTQDKNSGSIVRSYDGNLDISMDWPPGTTLPNDCEKHMDALIDGCGGGNSNPMNWKHGGTYSNGKIAYHVTPTKDRYVHGQCAVHVHEKETWSGVDGPGTSRTWHFWVDVTAKDFSGKTIGGTDGHVGAGDGNPAIIKGLYYEDLSLTPEARGDYIQFNLGSQSWTTKDKACNVGGFDSNYSPAGRDMDCFFDC